MENKLQKSVSSSATIIQQISNSNLTKEEKLMLEKQIFDAEIDLRKRMGESYIAENDMNMILDKFSELEKNKKYVSVNQTVKTGSGNIHIKTSTFDYNFVSYLTIVAIVIVLIVLIS